MVFCFLAAIMILLLWNENSFERYKDWIYENNHHFDEEQFLNKKESLK
jgi:hypothetical protein